MGDSYSQGERLMNVTTPVAADVLLLTGFSGEERINGLFEFRIQMVAPQAKTAQVKFESLIGQSIVLECDVYTEGKGGGDKHRYFNGICNRFAELGSDDDFVTYEATIVPKVWTLTRYTRNRIFQQLSVPDILKKVFVGLDMQYSIQGNFEPRNYCVQYRESDFDFACRLMEEEGIFYFFKHTKSAHTMVVTNSGLNYPDVPGPKELKYEVVEGEQREGLNIHEWVKRQELRSGKVTLWDENFQLPKKNLEAQKTITETVQVGKVSHKLKVGGNDQFERYDFPGDYGKRFDGIGKSGDEQPAETQKIFQDNVRTAGLRMEEEAAPSILIESASNCIHLVAGHKFTLKNHVSGEGDYIVTSTTHDAKVGTSYRSGEKSNFSYSNKLTCIPSAHTYRPPRETARPVVNGVQTAIVVGPAGEEIFTDKYGRIKVQFKWDRLGANDANSSCWLRVATLWAGKQWGMIHIPRIGQEVLVDFMEGDPDMPIVVGSVYNPETMPTYKLPDNKTRSGVRTRSTLQGTADNFNEIRFEDKKGSEQIFINAEMDLDFRVEHDARHFVGNDEHAIVDKNRKEKVGAETHLHLVGKAMEKMDDEYHTHVVGKRVEKMDADAHAHIVGNHVVKVDQSVSTKVGMSRQAKMEQNETVEAGMAMYLKGGMNVVVEAGTMLTLKVGGNFISISSAGVTIQGTMVLINSGGAAGAGSPPSPQDPAAPTDPTDPDEADDGSKGGKKS